MPDFSQAEPEILAKVAIMTIGLLVESYVESGYCDPLLYKALRLAKELSKGLEIEELTSRLEFSLITAGETVNKIIDENNIPIGKDEW